MLLGAPYLHNYASRTRQAASRDWVTPLQFNTNCRSDTMNRSWLICHTLSTKSGWEVLNDTFGSDHSPTITHINAVPGEDVDDCEKKFILSKPDWQSFKINARNLLTADLISDTVSADKNAELLTDAINKAAKLSIPQRKNRKNRLMKPLPYWNGDCNKAIRDRNKARNAMHKNKTLENCIRYRHLKKSQRYFSLA